MTSETKEVVTSLVPPILAAIVSAILTGAGTSFLNAQSEERARLAEERAFDNRLVVVEQAIKSGANVQQELVALTAAVTGVTTQISDLRAEVEWLRGGDREGRVGGSHP